jgi:hypothetical protein
VESANGSLIKREMICSQTWQPGEGRQTDRQTETESNGGWSEAKFRCSTSRVQSVLTVCLQSSLNGITIELTNAYRTCNIRKIMTVSDMYI